MALLYTAFGMVSDMPETLPGLEMCVWVIVCVGARDGLWLMLRDDVYDGLRQFEIPYLSGRQRCPGASRDLV